jgi:hypothetical protein
MKLRERRREAKQAERRLRCEQNRWRIDTLALRATLARHRVALILGGGFASGFIASFARLRALLRLGSMLGGAASIALRSPLAAMLIEGARRQRTGDAAKASNVSDASL